MAIIVARNINGVSINGREYLLDDETGEEKKFSDKEAAFRFLRARGLEDLSDDDFESYFIFEEVLPEGEINNTQPKALQRCYIAGKITGLPETQVFEKFRTAAACVCELGYIPVNPVELDHDHAKRWEDYMVEDIKQLKTCNAIYLLPDWEQSKGAKIEAEIAKALNLKIIYQDQTTAEDIDFEAKEYQGTYADDDKYD